MRDTVRTSGTSAVPAEIRPAIAELQGEISRLVVEATQEGAVETQLRLYKLFFFSDRLLFTYSKRSRGGRRGQKGESATRTLARRLRCAWNGEWGALWEESSESIALPGQHKDKTEEQRLAEDVKAIQDALADDDATSALRRIDGAVAMAAEAEGGSSCM